MLMYLFKENELLAYFNNFNNHRSRRDIAVAIVARIEHQTSTHS